MSDEKKRYPNSGAIFKNHQATAENKFAPYKGEIRSNCESCGVETEFYVNARVIDGKKGKFFGLSLKPKPGSGPAPGPKPAAQTTQAEAREIDEVF